MYKHAKQILSEEYMKIVCVIILANLMTAQQADVGSEADSIGVVIIWPKASKAAAAG